MAASGIEVVCDRRRPFARGAIALCGLISAAQAAVQQGEIGTDQYCASPILHLRNQCLAPLGVLFGLSKRFLVVHHGAALSLKSHGRCHGSEPQKAPQLRSRYQITGIRCLAI